MKLLVSVQDLLDRQVSYVKEIRFCIGKNSCSHQKNPSSTMASTGLDVPKLIFLMDNGRFRSPQDFQRCKTYPEVGLFSQKLFGPRQQTCTAKSCPTPKHNSARTKAQRQGEISSSPPRGKARCVRPKTPKTAIAYYSPAEGSGTPESAGEFYDHSRDSSGLPTTSTRLCVDANLLWDTKPGVRKKSKEPRKRSKKHAKSSSDGIGKKTSRRMSEDRKENRKSESSNSRESHSTRQKNGKNSCFLCWAEVLLLICFKRHAH